MLRPMFLDHEQDERTFDETDDFMLGRDLLVASVVEPGARRRKAYLPDNQCGWYDWYSGQWFAGGQDIVLDAPLERLPLMVRAGAAIPLSDHYHCQDNAQDDRRRLALFPLLGTGSSTGMLYEDDGESFGWRDGHALWLRWEMHSGVDRIDLRFTPQGDYRPAWNELTFVLPADEERKLYIDGTPASTYRLV